MSTRKQRRKEASPYRGSGRFFQYVRCPCCGKLARGPAIGRAGTHTLNTMQITKSLGGRKGFVWDRRPVDKDVLEQLLKALELAIKQVKNALWTVRFGPTLDHLDLNEYLPTNGHQPRLWDIQPWGNTIQLKEDHHAKVKVGTRSV